jgi:hypothetical protein
MSQTSYPTALVTALAGMLADIGPNRTRSMRNADAAEIAFGLGVTLKASDTDDAAKLPAASGDKLAGIVMHTQVSRTETLANLSAVEIGGRANVLEQGKIWVAVEGAVVAGGAVYCRYATGTGTQKGAFRADADTSSAALVKGAKFLTSTAGAGLAQIEFDTLAANT